MVPSIVSWRRKSATFSRNMRIIGSISQCNLQCPPLVTLVPWFLSTTVQSVPKVWAVLPVLLLLLGCPLSTFVENIRSCRNLITCPWPFVEFLSNFDAKHMEKRGANSSKPVRTWKNLVNLLRFSCHHSHWTCEHTFDSVAGSTGHEGRAQRSVQGAAWRVKCFGAAE